MRTDFYRSSTLMNMYFGESQKLVRALFSMCRKLAPCILFIDEVDMFLSARSRGNDEVVSVRDVNPRRMHR